MRALLGFRVLQGHTERYLTWIGVVSKMIFGRKTRANNALKPKGKVSSKEEKCLFLESGWEWIGKEPEDREAINSCNK